MTTVTVTSKRQLTIPAEVRLALQLNAGDRIEFVQIEPGQFLIVAANRCVTALKGMFGKTQKKVLISDMNSVIAARGHPC